MVFQKFKEDVVVEKGWSSIKDIHKMTLRLGLLFILGALGLGLITFCTVGWIVTLLVLLIAGIGFVWMFDLADEDEASFKTTMRLSKFWWCGIIFDVGIVIILKLFNFL